MAGNDVLIYNSLNGKILEYRDSPAIAELIKKAEDARNGFLAEVDPQSVTQEVETLISVLRENFCGDLTSMASKQKPSVIRPRAVIKNYPPAKDFPSFLADDYLRNIYFFLNQDNNTVCKNYMYADRQFFCPVYNSDGYSEIPFETAISACSRFAGSSNIGLELSGSDLTAYSGINELLSGIKKLLLKVNFHLPLPLKNEDVVTRLLKANNSRTSFYITFPDGPEALKNIRKNPEYIKKQKRIIINFLIRSMDEYGIIKELLNGNDKEKIFFLPYFNGKNEEFFRENVFLTGNDIVNLKPDQKQVYSRMLINEHLYGKIFIKTGGEVFANPNHKTVGTIYGKNISEIVRQEVEHPESWELTRSKVKPCSNCLYRLFCPPIGNYELFMKRFNFCDVL